MPVSAPPGPLIPDSSEPNAERTGASADGGSGIGEWVGRYSRLVFSTARRRMGDEEAAKEVTQNVFLMAYRKLDELKNVKRPAAWFHRAAMLESSNYLRAEHRRQRRLEALAAEQCAPAAPPEEEGWRVHLDEAVNALKGQDRELVLDRFFEGCSFQELAERRGSTPDAVRVRLSRILEKLCAVMKRRGATVSVTMLAGAMSSQWIQAAPAGLASAVTAASAAGETVKSSVFLAMASAKSISLTAAALVLAGISLGSQSSRLEDLRTRLEERRSAGVTAARFSASDGGEAGRGRRTALTVRASPFEPAGKKELEPLTARTMLEAVRELLATWKASNTSAYAHIDKPLERKSLDEIRKLLAELDAVPGGAQVKEWLRSSLVGRTMARKDPQAAIQEAIRRRMNDSVFLSIAMNWTKQDREGAVKSLVKMLENPESFPASKFGANPAGALRRGMIAILAAEDFPAALELCRGAAGTPAAGDYLVGLAEPLSRKGGADTVFEVLPRDISEPAKIAVLAQLARAFSSYSPGETQMLRFFDHPHFPQELRKEVILRAALAVNADGIDDNNPLALHMIGRVSRKEDAVETYAAWMREANPPREPYRVYPAGDERHADELTERVLRKVAPLDSAAAQRWLIFVHNPDLRASLAGELNLTAP